MGRPHGLHIQSLRASALLLVAVAADVAAVAAAAAGAVAWLALLLHASGSACDCRLPPLWQLLLLPPLLLLC